LVARRFIIHRARLPALVRYGVTLSRMSGTPSPNASSARCTSPLGRWLGYQAALAMNPLTMQAA
jgi:hypothetical protein